MELRVLKYFVTVVDEGSITNAARVLHVTQPTLSRQLSQLEAELGTPLLVRGRNGVELTDRGALLNRHAREILELANKAEEEVAIPRGEVAGTVHIGAGETHAFSVIATACARVCKSHPKVTFDVHDGTSADLKDGFARGLYDFLLDCDAGENAEFNQLTLPITDVWGITMRTDDPLATCDIIHAEDLAGRPLIASRRAMSHVLSKLADDAQDKLEVVSTFGLPLNSRYLVLAGVGVMLTYGNLVSGPQDENLCFRPLVLKHVARHKVLWRKAPLTAPAQVFLGELQELCKS